jgi:hypothetical protein
MSARIFIFPTFDRGFSDVAQSAETAAIDNRPDLFEQLRHADEGTDEIAPGAAIVAFVGMWLAEHWPAMLLGGVAGMLGLAIPALVVARMLP